MAETARTLDEECSLFHRYLIGIDASDYVQRKYREAHEPGRLGPEAGSGARRDAVLGLARRGPLGLRLADAYAAVFQRRGLFRRKLVLLVAILESYGPTAGRVDSPDPGTPAGFVAGAALRAVGFAVTALAAVPVVLVLRAVGAAARGRTEAA